MKGWRPALRLAWRDALRSPGRSVLVLVMIALPVLAVSAAAVVYATSSIDGVEGADRRLGAADALIRPVGGDLYQSPDPELWGYGFTSSDESGEPPTFDAVTAVLGAEVRSITLRKGFTEVPLGDRRIGVTASEVDLSDPLAKGLFTVTSGQAPAADDQVVVNDTLAGRGFGLGDTITVGDADLEVVGIGRDATVRDMGVVIARPGALGAGFAQYNGDLDWLVDAGGDVTWSQVREMNHTGLVVTSRAVLADPPPVQEIAEAIGIDTGYDDYLTVVVLIITMALLEVVLLAGPAFAVSARRQARTLALMAASGATPAQARRVVLASGIVLGTAAALVGAVLGVIVGLALLPVAQRYSGIWFGPTDVQWTVVAVVAAFGVLSAFLAAVVPASIASRQDVVAVLSGRRGDRAPSPRTPVLGLVLLAVGIALSGFGAVGNGSSGSTLIAVGAIVSVFGVILVAGLVVDLVARSSRVFPLVLRYAARDAARHRTRTVPAVAAVAATVAGVVALGIGMVSDEAQNRETYTQEMPMDAGMVNIYPSAPMNGTVVPPTSQTWDEVEALAKSRVDEVEVVRGVQQDGPDGSISVTFGVAGNDFLLEGWGGRLNASVVVADTVPDFADLDAEQSAIASQALADGSAVVFSSAPVDVDEATVRVDRWAPDSETPTTDRLTWPAVFVQAQEGFPVVQAIAPPALAAELDHPIATAGLYLPDPELSLAAQADLLESLHGITPDASIYVERGYQTPDEVVIVQWILGVLGGVLMLGGTLTATFLALSDARPDLATLSAVGAAPRARRGVAAAYALVVGLVGAVLGAIVGFIPGIAITRPLTTVPEMMSADQTVTGPFLDIPWLLVLGLVVALPLLTAAIVGLTARSRLPLAGRLN